MPIHRWIGNRILVATFNFLFGTAFTDICSGMNAFWKDIFLRVEPNIDGFEFEQSLIARQNRRYEQDKGLQAGADQLVRYSLREISTRELSEYSSR
jgi:hypothetical protein